MESLEKKLQKDPAIMKEYDKIFRDIKSAFLSIEIDKEDRDAFRFFWFDRLDNKEVESLEPDQVHPSY